MKSENQKRPALNKLPRGSAIEVVDGVCFANKTSLDPKGRGIKPTGGIEIEDDYKFQNSKYYNIK